MEKKPVDKNLVMTRCRKVFIPLQDRKIFGYGRGADAGEFDFVHIFREQAKAQSAVHHKESSHHYVFDKPEKKLVKHEVGSFYLVPSSLIENV